MQNTDAFSQAVVRLFETERFYAEIIARMQKIITPKGPIAAVCIKQHVQLHININEFSKYSLDQRAGVLKHECEHILRDHISRAKSLYPEIYAKTEDTAQQVINNAKHTLINVAADCAINGGIKHLPPEGCFPHKFDLADGNTMEWYIANLKDNEKLKGLTEHDGHSLWGESDSNQETLKEKIRQMINGAAKAARAAGCMSSEHEALVEALNVSVVNWGAQLRRFVAKTLQTNIDSSRKKRNRRYGIAVPGLIKTENLRIGVAIDTSGSVSDEALAQFMAEIEQIAHYAEVLVVEADSEIKKSYVFKKKNEYKLSGRGGTAYQPAFDFFNLEQVDAVIYFGDMDVSDEKEIKKPKYPVLWAIIGESEPPVEFGAKVYVKLADENNS